MRDPQTDDPVHRDAADEVEDEAGIDLEGLVLEEGLSRLTEYPDLILGPLLLLVAIYVNGGIDGLLEGRRDG